MEIIIYAAVQIGGTLATLGSTGHNMTCTLVGSGATNLTYQWTIGGGIVQPFSPSNHFVILTVGVSDAHDDYSCKVREPMGGVYTGYASLHIKCKYYLVNYATANNSHLQYLICR